MAQASERGSLMSSDLYVHTSSSPFLVPRESIAVSTSEEDKQSGQPTSLRCCLMTFPTGSEPEDCHPSLMARFF